MMSGRLAPLLYKKRANDVVYYLGKNGDDEQNIPPERAVTGIEPDHRRDQHQGRTELRKAKHEYHRGQHPHRRHAR